MLMYGLRQSLCLWTWLLLTLGQMKAGLFFLQFTFLCIRCMGQDGSVAQELVGKWCLVNPGTTSTDAMTASCITLNADGSYEIHLDRAGSVNANTFYSTIQESDYGTWSVKDDRIFYRSTSQGDGSFRLQKINHPRLENTPSIVLDGLVFCAAFAHDPW